MGWHDINEQIFNYKIHQTMIDNWEIHYWNRNWKNKSEFIGQIAIVISFFSISAVVAILTGVALSSVNPLFIILLLFGIFFFIMGLAFFPFQPVTIKYVGSQLLIKKHMLWNRINIDISKIIGWTFSSEKPFFVLRISDVDKKYVHALDAAGWMWIPAKGMRKNDLHMLIKFFDEKIKREAWDIGSVD